MQSLSRFYWCSGFLALALLSNACAGRAINKNMARDIIAGSPAESLAKTDIEVLSLSQTGPHEAIADTSLHAAFRLEKIGNEWVVREVRVGKGQWERLDNVLSALRLVKIEETRRTLAEIASAVEAYRQKNGALPVFRDYVDLSDILCPTYLPHLIRVDVWGHPLAAFRMSAGSIRLVSAGPDGKPGSADDIELIIP